MRDIIRSSLFLLGFTVFVVGVFLFSIGIGYYSALACPFVPISPCASGYIYWPDALPGILSIILGLGLMIGSRFPFRELLRDIALRFVNNLRSSVLSLGLTILAMGLFLFLLGESYTLITCPNVHNDYWACGGGFSSDARLYGIILILLGAGMMIGSRFVKGLEVHMTQAGTVNTSSTAMGQSP